MHSAQVSSPDRLVHADCFMPPFDHWDISTPDRFSTMLGPQPIGEIRCKSRVSRTITTRISMPRAAVAPNWSSIIMRSTDGPTNCTIAEEIQLVPSSVGQGAFSGPANVHSAHVTRDRAALRLNNRDAPKDYPTKHSHTVVRASLQTYDADDASRSPKP